jgi:hypothetical protein
MADSSYAVAGTILTTVAGILAELTSKSACVPGRRKRIALQNDSKELTRESC